MLVLDLGVGRVVDPELRHGRAEQGLLDICHPVRIRRRTTTGHPLTIDGMAGTAPAEPGFQILVADLRLDQIFEEFLGDRDVFCPLRDQAAGVTSLARHRLAVVAERQAHRDDVVVILLLALDSTATSVEIVPSRSMTICLA